MMTKYDLLSLRVKLAHATTAFQARRAIDSFPEIQGWNADQVRKILLTDDAVKANRTIEEQNRVVVMRQSAAYQRRIKWQ